MNDIQGGLSLFTARLFLFRTSLLFVSINVKQNSLAMKKVQGQSEVTMVISNQKL